MDDSNILANSSNEEPTNLDFSQVPSIDNQQQNNQELSNSINITIEEAQLENSDQPTTTAVMTNEPSEPTTNSLEETSINNPNKRKRSVEEEPDCKKSAIDNEDESFRCSICLENCEISGDHRLASLKCGHLFGFKCIRRWVTSREHCSHFCPECKARAYPREIRCLFVKKLKLVDRSEEHRLRRELSIEKSKNQILTKDFRNLSESLLTGYKLLRQQNVIVNDVCSTGTIENNYKNRSYEFVKTSSLHSYDNKCMIYVSCINELLISQKFSSNLVKEFGIRRIDMKTLNSSLIPTGQNGATDLSINFDSTQLAVVTNDSSAKMIDLTSTATIATIFFRSPKQIPISTCAFDSSLINNIYFGSKLGNLFIYDHRNLKMPYKNVKDNYDTSAIIKICDISKSETFPNGGIIVCKLHSIVVYENDVTPIMTQIHIDGPYVSMSYDKTNELLFISAHKNVENIKHRYIIGKLIKIRDRPFFSEIRRLSEPETVTAWTPFTHIPINQNHLIATCSGKENHIKIFDITKESNVQIISNNDKILMLSSFNIDHKQYLASLLKDAISIYSITEGCGQSC